MATLMLSVEGVSARRRSGKPRLLLRGNRRKAAINALKQLRHLENQEFNEARRSSNNGYNPFLVLGASNSRFTSALALLKDRLSEALKAKA